MSNAVGDITRSDISCRKLAICCHLCCVSSFCNSVYKHKFTLIPELIINYVNYYTWVETTYPFPNVNCETVEVSKWIRNFIPHAEIHWLLIYAGIKRSFKSRSSQIYEFVNVLETPPRLLIGIMLATKAYWGFNAFGLCLSRLRYLICK